MRHTRRPLAAAAAVAFLLTAGATPAVADDITITTAVSPDKTAPKVASVVFQSSTADVTKDAAVLPLRVNALDAGKAASGIASVVVSVGVFSAATGPFNDSTASKVIVVAAVERSAKAASDLAAAQRALTAANKALTAAKTPSAKAAAKRASADAKARVAAAQKERAAAKAGGNGQYIASVPAGVGEAGIYRVIGVSVGDKAGNSITLSADNEKLSGAVATVTATITPAPQPA